MPTSLKKSKPRKAQKSPKAEICKLTRSQEVFCLLYMGEYLGNGIASYSVAYDIAIRTKADYNNCASSASRLLRNVKVIEYLSELKKKTKVNEDEVVAQLDFLIRQDADFKAKLGAIRLRRDVEGRTKDTGDIFNQYNLFVQEGRDPKEEAAKYHKWLEQETVPEKLRE